VAGLASTQENIGMEEIPASHLAPTDVCSLIESALPPISSGESSSTHQQRRRR
jgi:hypothetical protein